MMYARRGSPSSTNTSMFPFRANINDINQAGRIRGGI